MSDKQMEMMAREHDMSGVDAEVAEEVAQAAASGVKNAYHRVEDAVVEGYKKIEEGVVEGYKKIETGVVEGFGRVTDKCVEVFFAEEGETVEEAKERLSGGK